jgi:hypothetical protein
LSNSPLDIRKIMRTDGMRVVFREKVAKHRAQLLNFILELLSGCARRFLQNKKKKRKERNESCWGFSQQKGEGRDLDMEALLKIFALLLLLFVDTLQVVGFTHVIVNFGLSIFIQHHGNRFIKRKRCRVQVVLL